MNMREIMNLVDARTLNEGRMLKLEEYGRSIILDPTRTDLKQMLTKSAVLRGCAVENPSGGWTVMVWPARLLSHWSVMNEIMNKDVLGYRPVRYFSTKIGLDPDKLREDRYWRDADPIDCGDYVVLAAMFVGVEPSIIDTNARLGRLFGPRPDPS